jgi:hypothetical protein
VGQAYKGFDASTLSSAELGYAQVGLSLAVTVTD